jgi:pimeloyl-ACP methyl ester carboxylesterase
MPIIKINNKKIYYNIQGNGPYLILLHDGFYNTTSWDSVRDKLSKYFTVIDYDRFGYGKSDKFSEKIQNDIINLYVEELEAIVNKLKLKKFYLCGHCLGGAIALIYAVRNPDKVLKIIAESVGYFSDKKILIKSDMTFRPFEMINEKLKKALIKMNGNEYAKKFWEIISDYNLSYIMSDNYNILNEIKKINCPVFIINGDRDIYFDVDHPLKAYKIIKKSILWIVPDTNHIPHIEKKDDFINNLIRFIKSK